MTTQCPQCGSSVQQPANFCPNCGAGLVVRGVSETEKPGATSKRRKYTVQIVLGLVLIGGILTFYRDAFRTYHPVIEKQPDVLQASGYRAEKIPTSPTKARIEGPFIIVSLKEVVEKKLVRFSDPEGKQTVPVIAYVTPSGRLVTAMSLSENCRSTDFYLEGENIHCASCPSYWNASSLEAYACCQKFYPDPIPSTVLGDEIRIEAEVVRKWQPRS